MTRVWYRIMLFTLSISLLVCAIFLGRSQMIGKIVALLEEVADGLELKPKSPAKAEVPANGVSVPTPAPPTDAPLSS